MLMRMYDGPEVVGVKVEDWTGDSIIGDLTAGFESMRADEEEMKRKAERQRRLLEEKESLIPQKRLKMVDSSVSALKALYGRTVCGGFVPPSLYFDGSDDDTD